jgi:hypothetical protein
MSLKSSQMDFFYKANMEKSRETRYRHNKDLVEDIFAEARGMFEDLTSTSSDESSCSADSESDDSSENLPQEFPRVESEDILC